MSLNTLPTTTDSVSRAQATAFALHLREHVPRYFQDFGRVEVHIKLVSERQRDQSALYRFEVSSEEQRRRVLVKAPSLKEAKRDQPCGEGQHLVERPRLTPRVDTKIKFRLEYRALSAIHDYFHGLGDPRFGTIFVLDYLPHYDAIVMEEVQDPSLGRLFAKVNRLQSLVNSIELDAAFRNAGAWLRAYHGCPDQDVIEVRHAARTDFIKSISEFTGFLMTALGDEPFFRSVALKSITNAFDALPESLLCGLRHGDYAMRNVLIGPSDRVTVLDTLANWRTPIYQDIGHFLTDLKMNQAQILSQGLAFHSNKLIKYEDEFLVGYFGRQQLIPLRAIRLYEIQALLNKWSDKVSRFNQEIRGTYHTIERSERILTNRFFRKRIEHLLQATSSK